MVKNFLALIIISLAFSLVIVADRSKMLLPVILLLIFGKFLFTSSETAKVKLIVCSVFFPIYFQVFGKDAFESSTILIIGLSFIRIFNKRKINFITYYDNNFVLCFGIFICGIISTLFVFNDTYLFGKSIRHLLFLLSSCLIYFTISSMKIESFRKKQCFVEKVIDIIIFGTVVQVVIGIIVLYFPDFGNYFSLFVTSDKSGLEASVGEYSVKRLNTIIFTEEQLGEFGAMLIPWLVYKINNNKPKIYYVAFFILICGLIMTATRSGVILSIISLFVALTTVKADIKRNIKIIFILTILIATSFVIFPDLFSSLFVRFNISLEALNRSDSYLNVFNRDFTFNSGFVYLMKTISFFGNGLVSPYDYGALNYHFHNLFFTILFQYGIIGSSIYFSFIVIIVLRLINFVHLNPDDIISKLFLLSIFVFLINEMKVEFNREAPYNILIWIWFSLTSLYINDSSRSIK